MMHFFLGYLANRVYYVDFWMWTLCCGAWESPGQSWCLNYFYVLLDSVCILLSIFASGFMRDVNLEGFFVFVFVLSSFGLISWDTFPPLLNFWKRFPRAGIYFFLKY